MPVSQSHEQTTRGGSQQTCHLRIIAPQVVKVEAEPRIAARQSALDGRQVSCLVNEVEECTLLLSNITHLGGRELCTREIEHPPSRNDPPRGLLSRASPDSGRARRLKRSPRGRAFSRGVCHLRRLVTGESEGRPSATKCTRVTRPAAADEALPVACRWRLGGPGGAWRRRGGGSFNIDDI